MAKGGSRTGSGRKRKPVEMRVIEGTFQTTRDGKAPRAAGGWPEPPDGVTDDERALWASLPRVPWIAESDRIAVHGAVAIYARIRANHQERAAAEAAGDHDTAGRCVDREIKLWQRLSSSLASLGLTPADRAKMQTGQPDANEGDEWAKLLG